MTGTSAFPIAPADQLRLLAGARLLDGPWGAVLQLCILTLCLPFEATAMDLERIDWDRGLVPVPSRSVADRVVALPHDAQKAILRIAGEARGRGQVVTAGRGRRFEARLFRMDRLLDRLAVAAPDTIGLPEWNMHGLRLGAEKAMRAEGASAAEIANTLGRATTPVIRGLRGDPELARLGAERWNDILRGDRAARPQRGGNAETG